MLWRIWGGVGAVACGIAVAAASGGQMFGWTYIVLLGALGFGIAATAIVWLTTRVRSRQVTHGPPIPPVATEPITVRQSLSDRTILEQLVSGVNERDLQWLQLEQFSEIWLDKHTIGFRAIAETDILRSGIFDADLAAAADSLTGAARRFFEVYDAETFPDSIMRDGSWRMIGRLGEDQSEMTPSADDRVASQKRLRTAAEAILEQRQVLLAKLGETTQRSA